MALCVGSHVSQISFFFFKEITMRTDEGMTVDIVHMDFTKFLMVG